MGRLQEEVAEVTRELTHARHAQQSTQRSLLRIEQSVSFQLVRKLSGRVYAGIGRDLPPAHLLQATLRLIGRTRGATTGR